VVSKDIVEKDNGHSLDDEIRDPHGSRERLSKGAATSETFDHRRVSCDTS
jgi:hypothetical protein